MGTYIDDLYDPAFTQAIGLASAITGTCGSNALCQKWMARYAADRPHITGDAAEVPILLVYGLEDTAIDKGRMACAVERLVVQDGASLTGCIDLCRAPLHRQLMTTSAGARPNRCWPCNAIPAQTLDNEHVILDHCAHESLC